MGILPNLAMQLAPLYQLLHKKVTWNWMSAQNTAFQESKKLFTSSRVFAHYNPKLLITLACDALAYGIGAVLTHKLPDGLEKPIGYASRTLNQAEKNYSQLERHAFELITDHKPLLGLFNEDTSTSSQASARIRRWSVYLSMFEYTQTIRKNTAHGNADALSRLPLPFVPSVDRTPPELVLLANHLADSQVTADRICVWIRKNPVLSSVFQFIQQGWPSSMEGEHSPLVPYFRRRTELSLHDGCILWGGRVVVPQEGQEAVLVQLQEGHPRITRMKSLARMYVWWSGISKYFKVTVQGCVECQINQATPPVAPLHPWSWLTQPWARLQWDFAGPVQGKMFLILVDAHSKWIEAFCTPNATSQAAIEELKTTFAKFGLPERIVTDIIE